MQSNEDPEQLKRKKKKNVLEGDTDWRVGVVIDNLKPDCESPGAK